LDNYQESLHDARSTKRKKFTKNLIYYVPRITQILANFLL